MTPGTNPPPKLDNPNSGFCSASPGAGGEQMSLFTQMSIIAGAASANQRPAWAGSDLSEGGEHGWQADNGDQWSEHADDRHSPAVSQHLCVPVTMSPANTRVANVLWAPGLVTLRQTFSTTPAPARQRRQLTETATRSELPVVWTHWDRQTGRVSWAFQEPVRCSAVYSWLQALSYHLWNLDSGSLYCQHSTSFIRTDKKSSSTYSDGWWVIYFNAVAQLKLTEHL